ncbi:maleylpyruvate isomerase family mycothiol-dependent enzyme [Nocardia sp. NBC_00565]|uniref:maleylpyruvate isomerase family mycothiol-dependent enzyme n=1 Tax=Nocardia sp. NBC_00565 TaxID=2975993 RepID=UPI002E81D8B4|nr:maleylpyruvate isomerase family mycothiol-dependent enzyme [Nocardia sp. NBC_00565]WUC05182.1 maleylpyruvate isomerase family mycothiol-dependent enzyme [Nocardia sp. NBC_00565]
MDRDVQWRVIEQQRRAVADVLAGLEPWEWEVPSLCAGWRIRDVAAHIALAPQPPGPVAMVREGMRARGRFHRMNHDVAVRYAEAGHDLVDEIRAHAGSRKLPVVTSYRNILFDIMVHGQDIAIPTGRQIELPVKAAATAATRVWTMGWAFWAKQRLRGLRLVATDVDWAVGAGGEVRGRIADLLLLATGRSVVLPRLTGAGVGELWTRLSYRNLV